MEIQKVSNMISPILKQNLKENNINVVASTTPVISNAPIDERKQEESKQDSFEMQDKPDDAKDHKKSFSGIIIGLSVALISLFMFIKRKK